jgi:DNA-binding phage protein
MTGIRPDVISLFIGVGLGIAGSLFIEWIRRFWEKKDKKDCAKKILHAICKEIEEGIERSRGLVNMAKENKISFSRIYTALWDSARLRISESIKDVEVLGLLHKIYYRFDLINFNMERERFSKGAAFATQYIAEIEANYASLRTKIDS